jgi:hypothetical protein
MHPLRTFELAVRGMHAQQGSIPGLQEQRESDACRSEQQQQQPPDLPSGTVSSSR